MTTDQMKSAVKRHRPAAILGGVAGLVVLLGWVGYVIVSTPARPEIETAKASEVIAYISNSRGLQRLPEIEQQQFLQRWKAHVEQPKNKEALRHCFDQLSDRERKQFTETISKYLKRTFMDDARHFGQLTDPAEQYGFLQKKLAEGHQQLLFIKEVAGAFKGDIGGREEFNQWVLSHTTAKERVIGERYVEALKRVALQARKEARAGNAASPG